MSEDEGIKFHDQSCANCRYFRIHKQEHTQTSECVLRGRTVGISSNFSDLIEWGRGRICQFWKKIPNTWINWTEENPYWNDPYIPSETIINLRKRAGLS